MKLKLLQYDSVTKGMNSKSSKPFNFGNVITYSTNGRILRGEKVKPLTQWESCEIHFYEWYKGKLYVYFNDKTEYCYSGKNFLTNVLLFCHCLLKTKLPIILGIIGGVYSILDIIISLCSTH